MGDGLEIDRLGLEFTRRGKEFIPSKAIFKKIILEGFILTDFKS